MKKLDFRNFSVPTGITRQTREVFDAREQIADLLYKMCIRDSRCRSYRELSPQYIRELRLRPSELWIVYRCYRRYEELRYQQQCGITCPGVYQYESQAAYLRKWKLHGGFLTTQYHFDVLQ